MNSTKNIDYVKRINNLGKVSKIILIIMRIACIVGIVLTIVGGIVVLATFPTGSTAITSNGTASYEMTADTNRLPSSISFFENEDITNESFKLFGTKFTLKDNIAVNDGIKTYTLNAEFDSPNSTLFKYGIVGVCFGMTIYAAFTLIVVIFAGKLAKALEKCQSPFEESVTKAMKHFAFSLIPAGFTFVTDGSLNLTMVLIILAVIIFSYIFSYGAKLQQESDETL
ncbi:MAG: hypothetical protein IJB68_09060 [Ruminococcus sp.]|nr:hypothetical protein [Ruminococcus sp.]